MAYFEVMKPFDPPIHSKNVVPPENRKGFTVPRQKTAGDLLSAVRLRQKQIINFFVKTLLPLVFDTSFRRKNRCFWEWLRVPMNYVRIVELPLTLELLELDHEHLSILDIASPKLLALYLACNKYEITASDRENYFVADFDAFSRKLGQPIQTSCFDATAIPYEPESFDRVFSISALEHIPDSGDIKAVKEAARILKPGGVFVMTLPAYKTHLEEWLKRKTFYWRGTVREDGCVFFQKRYSDISLRDRFSDLGLTIEEVIWIAEKPIREPCLNASGRLDHNFYYLEGMPYIKFIKKLTARIPLAHYWFYTAFSRQTHYLASSFHDKNIRQVAVKFRKP